MLELVLSMLMLKRFDHSTNEGKWPIPFNSVTYLWISGLSRLLSKKQRKHIYVRC